MTNEYGFYTLTIKGGKGISITYSYVGYDEKTVVFDLRKDTTINVALTANSKITEAVVSAKKESGIQATKMSAIEIPINIVKATPTLFGEADVLKTIQLMPGRDFLFLPESGSTLQKSVCSCQNCCLLKLL